MCTGGKQRNEPAHSPARRYGHAPRLGDRVIDACDTDVGYDHVPTELRPLNVAARPRLDMGNPLKLNGRSFKRPFQAYFIKNSMIGAEHDS